MHQRIQQHTQCVGCRGPEAPRIIRISTPRPLSVRDSPHAVRRLGCCAYGCAAAVRCKSFATRHAALQNAQRSKCRKTCSSLGPGGAATRQDGQGQSSNGNGRRVIGTSGQEGLGGSSSNGNADRFAGELLPTDDGSGVKPPGNGNGDDGGGGDDGDDGGGRGVWTVVASLAAAVVAGVALTSWLRWQAAREAPPRRTLGEDVAALKRLVREAFAELTAQGGRLHRLEHRSASGGGAGTGGWTTGADLAPSAAADITFVGAVEAAPALVLSQGGSAEALHAACATPDNVSGTGAPLMRGQLRSPARGGKDEVTAEVLLPGGDASGGPEAALQKVVYSLRRGSGERRQTWRLLAGRGRGDDVAATLNPAAGRGLTHLTRHGCALHQRARGSGVGVAARLSERVHVAAAHLVSGQPDADDNADDESCGPARSSSLAQATVAVSDACSVGLVVLRRRRPGCGMEAPLASSPDEAAGGWRLEGQLGDVVLPAAGSSGGSTSHALATTGTINVQHAALLSWWAAQSRSDGSGSGSGGRRLEALAASREFGVSLASHPLKGPGGWALALGRSHGPRLAGTPHADGTDVRCDPDSRVTASRATASTADDSGCFTALHSSRGGGGNGGGPGAAAAAAAVDGTSSDPGTANSTFGSTAPGSIAGDSGCRGAGGGGSPPWVAEASLQVPLGEGLALTPGFVAVRADGATTYALAARVQWAF